MDLTARHPNLKGDAIRDWNEHGLPALSKFLARSSPIIGDAKVTAVVRDCHSRRPDPTRENVRFRKEDRGSRRAELAIAPMHSRYSYDVDVTIGLPADLALVMERMAAAANGTGPDPKDEVPVMTTTKVERLTRMRDGIDLLLQHGKDVAAAHQDLESAEVALAAAKSAAGDLPERFKQAAEAVDQACKDLAASDKTLAAIHRELDEAKQAHGVRELEVIEARKVRDRLAVESAPHAAAIKKASADLRAAEALVAERKELVGKAGGIAELMAALERLGG